AFGLLRCCEEMEGLQGSRLGWRQEAEWFAVLETERPADPESLVAALATRQQQRPGARELNWADALKIPQGRYRDALREREEDLKEGRRAFADFLAAFACECWADDNGQLEPTAFSMTSGRQMFLKEARTLARRLAEGISIGRRKKTPQEMFR